MKPESLEALGAVPVTLAARAGEIREQLPVIAGSVTRLVADNPGPFLLSACGSYVIAAAVTNVVRPRGVPGILACGVTSYFLSAWLANRAIERGILKFRIRDADGNRVLVYPKAEGCECGGTGHETAPETGCPPGETVREHYAHGGRIGDA